MAHEVYRALTEDERNMLIDALDDAAKKAPRSHELGGTRNHFPEMAKRLRDDLLPCRTIWVTAT